MISRNCVLCVLYIRGLGARQVVTFSSSFLLRSRYCIRPQILFVTFKRRRNCHTLPISMRLIATAVAWLAVGCVALPATPVEGIDVRGDRQYTQILTDATEKVTATSAVLPLESDAVLPLVMGPGPRIPEAGPFIPTSEPYLEPLTVITATASLAINGAKTGNTTALIAAFNGIISVARQAGCDRVLPIIAHMDGPVDELPKTLLDGFTAIKATAIAAITNAQTTDSQQLEVAFKEVVDLIRKTEDSACQKMGGFTE